MLPEPCEELPQSFIPSFCSILMTTLQLVRNMFRSFSRTIMAMFDCAGWLDFMNIVYFTEHLALSVRTNKKMCEKLCRTKLRSALEHVWLQKAIAPGSDIFCTKLNGLLEKHTTTKHVQRIVLEL